MGIVRNKTMLLSELRRQKKQTQRMVQPPRGSRYDSNNSGLVNRDLEVFNRYN